MSGDNKNFIFAIVISTLIIFGWQYFYAGPKQKALEAQLAQQQTEQAAQTTSSAATAPATPAAPVENAILPREQAIAATPRVTIDTPSLQVRST